jgi:hypothetical protein
VRYWLLSVLWLISTGCRSGERAIIRTTNEQEIRAAFERSDVTVELPRGVTTISRALRIANSGIEVRGHSGGSTLAAVPGFADKALLSISETKKIRLASFTIDGGRQSLASEKYLPPSDVSFANFYDANGILAVRTTGFTVHDVKIRRVPGYAVLVSASSDVTVDQVSIEDCGSLDSKRRNNTTGGILLEEGTRRFRVANSVISRIPGNAIWTHSNYKSPRNEDGVIELNQVSQVARDAIQVGHATRIRVANNRGSSIGYPIEHVDIEGHAIPVAIDTAGNVDQSHYEGNAFTDVNGQCINLDGFHHGSVRRNRCVNNKPLDKYPFSHFGIAFSNTNPDMEPARVEIEDNLMQGFAYGGIFVLGSNHRVTGNRFIHVNRAGCTGDMSKALCNYAPEEPGMLRSALYLGRAGPRPAETRDNVITRNEFIRASGEQWCIEAAPGVQLAQNRLTQNVCRAGP